MKTWPSAGHATSTQLAPPDAVLFLHCKGICSKSATFASFSQEQTVPLRSPAALTPDLPSAYVIRLFERNVDEANLTGLSRSTPLLVGSTDPVAACYFDGLTPAA